MDEEFFMQDAEIVARGLLGCEIVRMINGNEIRSRIVETEAYYNENDPSSRACQNGDLRKTMEMRGGAILVYGVHNNWMLNFVTGKEEDAQAVLIRAVEPLNFEDDCRGPGKLTKSLKINKSFHKKNILNDSEIYIIKGKKPKEIAESFRIGVKKDLNKEMRFYIKGSKHVSRR